MAIGYIKERKQFGQAISDFQGVQFMLADMAMKIEAARQLDLRAPPSLRRDRWRRTSRSRPAPPSASPPTRRCRSPTDAVQLLGGYGYVKDFPVERMMRDAKITQIYEGTNQIQRMVMARQLLK